MARFTNKAWDNIYGHALKVCHAKGVRGIDIQIRKSIWPSCNHVNKKVKYWFVK